MRLEQLRYIVEIADTGSFTAASERLFIAQPSISQAVKALEEELHITIFKRYRTGTIPTQEGGTILEHARNILKDIAEIEKLSQREYREITGSIAIGSIPTLSSLLLPAVSSSYKEVFPNVNIYFSESGSKKIVEKCLKGEIDIGLISYHEDISDILPTKKQQDEPAQEERQFQLKDPVTGVQYQLTSGVTVIGREAQFREQLQARPYVSRIHAKLILEEGKCFIENLSHTNYTFVNNQRIPEGRYELHPGDLIGLGGIKVDDSFQEQAAYFVLEALG